MCSPTGPPYLDERRNVSDGGLKRVQGALGRDKRW